MPVRLAVGRDVEPEAVAWVDPADVAASPKATIAEILRGVADQLDGEDSDARD
jgi:hypothetical protein